jgi:hypothetical protein
VRTATTPTGRRFQMKSTIVTARTSRLVVDGLTGAPGEALRDCPFVSRLSDCGDRVAPVVVNLA